MGLELLLICRVGLMFHHLSTSGSNIAQKMGFSLKIPKKIMVNQSNHHFSPEVTSLFGVSLGSPNTPPVLGFPDVGWCPCHRCAQRQTSEPTWRGLPSPPRRDLRPHFYCLIGWLMMSKNRENYVKITDCYQFCRV